jgi:hypothetical protein
MRRLEGKQQFKTESSLRKKELRNTKGNCIIKCNKYIQRANARERVEEAEGSIHQIKARLDQRERERHT